MIFEETPLTEAVRLLSEETSLDARGAFFTRPEVVDLMLDLVDYRPDRDLTRIRLLEPCFGDGSFLLRIVRRLIISWKKHYDHHDAGMLADCIIAVELHAETYHSTRTRVIELLVDEGIEPSSAFGLADSWLVQGDFLLTKMEQTFDIIVGNPPYVRLESIPVVLQQEYRKRYQTMYDRADVYVAFIERSLSLLNDAGELSFICSDRWTKNKYGGPLRALIGRDYHLKYYIDMVAVDAFEVDVTAYTAITVISKGNTGPTKIVHDPQEHHVHLPHLAKALQQPVAPSYVQETTFEQIAHGDAPWLLNLSAEHELVRRLEAEFPSLQDTGCRVGIGVATGADKVFVGFLQQLPVEENRKLPLVTTKDIRGGVLNWQGNGVINPFEDDGSLVDLQRYPQLQSYLLAHQSQLIKRHVAGTRPKNWYRTIDRIWPELAKKEKLLIPDIKGDANIVYEPGLYYPHHNLYYIVSNQWPLQVLQAVLVSGLARLFVSQYTTKMRGGYLRFQAQHLRKIRLPQWHQLTLTLQNQLTEAAQLQNPDALQEVIITLFHFNKKEQQAYGY